MSDFHMNFGLQPHERPDDDEAREARHQVLATLLGAYSDGELPPETTSQIDAHLLGCARCRREVDVHTVVQTRLAREPLVPATAALHERIIGAVAIAARAPAALDVVATPRSAWWQLSAVRIGAALTIATVAVVFGAARLRSAARTANIATASVDAATVPLFTAILDDYRTVMSSDLPGRARDLDAVRAAVPFPVQPLHREGASLLAAWSTDLRGEPAAVLAYRWHDRLVLEYLVAEPVFFRHPGVRTPVAAGALVTSRAASQGLIAWAAPEAGVILVGDVSPDELLALRVGGTGR